MELVLDEKGNAVLKDGKPLYRHPDGKEIVFDAGQAFSKIGQLTGENTAYKARFTEAETKLKSFDGIADPDAARKALDTVSNLDHKKLIDAGEVEKVKGEITKAFQAQLDEANGKAKTLEQALYGEKVGGAFARSKMIAEKLAIPADMVQARFGQAFKIEGDKTVAYDASGNKIFSRARPGELADFDEALETLIEQYPYKEHILKSSGASGGGAQGSGTGGGGKQTRTRQQFEQMMPSERAAFAKDMKEGRALITD